MRKIVIGMHAGLAGTDAKEFYLVPDGVTDKELNNFAWERGKDHAEMYGIYPKEEYADSGEVSEEELDSDTYSENIEGWFEEYNPKKHDGYSHNGEPDWQEY